MYALNCNFFLLFLAVLQSRGETVPAMLAEVFEAGERLKFLMDYALLTEEDIRLNNLTFNWPGRMEPIFEVSDQRLMLRRQKAEEMVKLK